MAERCDATRSWVSQTSTNHPPPDPLYLRHPTPTIVAKGRVEWGGCSRRSRWKRPRTNLWRSEGRDFFFSFFLFFLFERHWIPKFLPLLRFPAMTLVEWIFWSHISAFFQLFRFFSILFDHFLRIHFKTICDICWSFRGVLIKSAMNKLIIKSVKVKIFWIYTSWSQIWNKCFHFCDLSEF